MGVAGFCFGNIMLLSLPAYLGADFITDLFYLRLFAYLQLALSLPVVFYVATDYYRSAFYSLKSKSISIDIPLTLGIFVLFGRSLFEIITESGFGFFDSLSGLLFFMMIGKWFQQNTYENMVFDRDYKSYFPIAVTQLINDAEQSTTLENIQPGDVLVIRSGELIPCDGILLSDETNLDYSFVTGENEPVRKLKSEHLYSGARVKGGIIKIRVTKSVDQSYLTQLWNNDIFDKKSNSLNTLLTRTSKYFTVAILMIATATAVFWYFNDPSKISDAVTYVLIITCPCAFALTTPFTFGNVIRLFGKNGLFLKDAHVIESMAKVDTIVFDKTGTLTYLDKKNVSWQGRELTEDEKKGIRILCNNSTHPFSRSISLFYSSIKINEALLHFEEIPGKGIQGTYKGKNFKLGSKDFIGNPNAEELNESHVYLSVNGEHYGYFSFKQSFRENVKLTLASLKNNYGLQLLSGDKPSGNASVLNSFGEKNKFFSQTPIQKLEHIQQLNAAGKHVAVVGDGLNDAGALRASDFGITVTDDVNSFTPSSDAIMNAEIIKLLPSFFKMSKISLNIVKYSFLLSFIYNVVGLTLAITVSLTPLFAAVFMPLSSITIILFVTSMVRITGKRIFKFTENQLPV